ncbi:MAG: replication initiation protein, partial [Pseudomonadota bacterium]|nr:replication initiation protein [Pseudomonadota bacterium]
ALALYENCYRFIRTGSTGWWPLDLFRRLMGVDGSAYYESFKHLNAKVIKPAVAEVNKTSNILVTPETRKKGRVVTEIRFRIKENPQLAILDIDDGEGARHGPVYARLRDAGVSDRLARQWLSTHGEGQVAAKLDYVENREGVRSKVGYLSAALEGDFSAEAQEPTPPPSERGARLGRILAAAKARTPTQRDADKRLFLGMIDDPVARADFERHGWTSPLNAERIAAFWEDMGMEG